MKTNLKIILKIILMCFASIIILPLFIITLLADILLLPITFIWKLIWLKDEYFSFIKHI